MELRLFCVIPSICCQYIDDITFHSVLFGRTSDRDRTSRNTKAHLQNLIQIGRHFDKKMKKTINNIEWYYDNSSRSYLWKSCQWNKKDHRIFPIFSHPLLRPVSYVIMLWSAAPSFVQGAGALRPMCHAMTISTRTRTGYYKTFHNIILVILPIDSLGWL